MPVVLSIGSGSAVWASPESPFNKVVGIGMASSFADDELDAVEALFADRGAAVQIELSTLAERDVGERLTRRGYLLVGFENVLGLRLEPDCAAETAPRVTLRTVAPDEFESWIGIDVEASSTPDTRGIGSYEEFSREAIEPRAALLVVDILQAAWCANVVAIVAARRGCTLRV